MNTEGAGSQPAGKCGGEEKVRTHAIPTLQRRSTDQDFHGFFLRVAYRMTRIFVFLQTAVAGTVASGLPSFPLRIAGVRKVCANEIGPHVIKTCGPLSGHLLHQCVLLHILIALRILLIEFLPLSSVAGISPVRRTCGSSART